MVNVFSLRKGYRDKRATCQAYNWHMGLTFYEWALAHGPGYLDLRRLQATGVDVSCLPARSGLGFDRYMPVAPGNPLLTRGRDQHIVALPYSNGVTP